MEERLRRIESMGQHIDACVRGLRQVVDRSGTSAEARERAVAAFYERVAAAQRQLERIQEDLRLT
jgi:hypothetical protein